MVNAISSAAQTAQNKENNSCAEQLLAQLQEYDEALLAQGFGAPTISPADVLPPSAE
jgi:hypothetical protein